MKKRNHGEGKQKSKSKEPQSELPVECRSSEDPFWLFEDPLEGIYALCGNSDSELALAVFASEALARAEENALPILRQVVVREASWSEVQKIAARQCHGRWRLFWARPVALRW